MRHWTVGCVSAKVDGRGCVQLGVIDHKPWCSCILEVLVNGDDAVKTYAGFCISAFDSCYHGRVSAIAGLAAAGMAGRRASKSRTSMQAIGVGINGFGRIGHLLHGQARGR